MFGSPAVLAAGETVPGRGPVPSFGLQELQNHQLLDLINFREAASCRSLDDLVDRYLSQDLGWPAIGDQPSPQRRIGPRKMDDLVDAARTPESGIQLVQPGI